MADSLAAFAAAASPAPPCAICDLPPDIRKQVEAAPKSKISAPTVEKWLDGLGFTATRHQQARHRRDHTPLTTPKAVNVKFGHQSSNQ